MANWKDIGKANYEDALILIESKKYRSASSRLYYAVFSVVTQELIDRGASPDFKDRRLTPGHGQLIGLVEKHFVHFSEERLRNFTRAVSNTYRDRILSDYNNLPIDYNTSRETLRNVVRVFKYLGVDDERS